MEYDTRRHPSPVQTAAAITQSFPSAAPVAVIAEHRLTDGEMLALHEVGDCFISLARAEGWGLGAFEAASLGNPVLHPLHREPGSRHR
jgi:short subunit fatty acids transporter